MEIKNWIVWIAAAALTSAFFLAGLWLRQDETPPPQAAAEPDLFPFLKPMDAIRPGGDRPADIAAREDLVPNSAFGDVPTPAQIAATEQAGQILRARGGSEDEVYRLRAGALSPAAATRLAEMEREETAWTARVGAYLVERNNLPGGNPGAGMERSWVVQQLRDGRFTPEEQALLAAYESPGVPQLVMD